MSQEGARIGNRFVLRRPLGRGGMAEVWLAWDEQQQIEVALKLLVPQVVLDEEGRNRFRVRFQREADAIRRLDSPHVVRLIDFGDTDGELYMALSYVNGKPLSATLREEGAQSPNRVREIARQMATGLEVAHRSGVLHRDLKPANVMITRTAQGRDHVVLVDFGIAHVLRSATGETLTRITSEGSMIGTPRYLPPEYIRGEHFDERSDLFSLGLILYEMLEGEAAVAGQDTVQIIARHLDQAPFRLHHALVGRDRGLASIVHRLLEKNPDDRLQSAAELRQALLNGGVAPAREPTHTVEKDLGAADEGIDIATVAAAVFILFIAIVAGYLLFGQDGSSEVDDDAYADGALVIGEDDAMEFEESDPARTARNEARNQAQQEARFEVQMAVLDATSAARPRQAAAAAGDGDEAEVSDQPRDVENQGVKLRLPDNEAMNEIRKHVPRLTVE